MRAALKKNGILYLLVGIPVVSLLMGAVTLYVAFTYADKVVTTEHAPLTKMSWQDQQADNDR